MLSTIKENFIPVAIPAMALFYFIFNNYKSDLTHNKARKKCIKKLSSAAFEPWYRRQLIRILGYATNWFGSGLFSSRALSVCLTISFFYSTGLFLFSWAISGEGYLGNTLFLPGDWNRWLRFLFVLEIVIVYKTLAIVMDYVIKYSEKFDSNYCYINLNCFSDRMNRSLSALVLVVFYSVMGALAMVSAVFVSGPSTSLPLPIASSGAVIGGIGGLGTVLVARAANVTITVFGAIILPLVASIPVVATAAIAGAGAGVISAIAVGAGAAMGAKSRAGKIGTTGIIAASIAAIFLGGAAIIFFAPLEASLILPWVLSALLFFFILPVTNAILDWISWGISRGMGHLILKTHRIKMMVTHTLIDFVVATFLLSFLAFLLAGSIEALNIFAENQGQSRPLDLANLLGELSSHPFEFHVLWVTIMLLSTLAPTVIHIIVLIFGSIVFVTPGWWRTSIKNTLKSIDKKNPNPLSLNSASYYFTTIWFLAAGIIIGISWIGLQLIAWAQKPVADLLLDIANLAISLINLINQ
ncbi:MAG: hypothetical protein HQL69_02430 [Magnetococcales bacterium]|nr:hypothetical protein [Magnetococcales bacterium]